MTSMPFESPISHVDDLSNMIYGAMTPFASPSLSWTDASVNAMELTMQWMAAASIPYVQCMNAWMSLVTSMSGIATHAIAVPVAPIPATEAAPAKAEKITPSRSKKH
jgi:hypothetical protein